MAIRLKEIPAVLVRSYLAGTNIFLRSKPGIGKTMTITGWAHEMTKRVEDFQLWCFYAPTMSPMDIQASAPDYETGKLRLFNNEALPNAYLTPDAKGAVFFGELPNADATTAKLLQKYINGEDMSGVLRKPEGIIVIADGNRLQDKSSVQQQGRAFLNRFEQVEVYAEPADNVEYALEHNWHPHVQAFFRENSHLIDNYDEVFETDSSVHSRKGANAGVSDTMSEEGKMGIWANMRSWERVHKKEVAAEMTGTTVSLAELIGNLGTSVGTAYDTFKAMFARFARFEDIMADPANVKIPKAMDEMFGMAVLVAVRCEHDQLPKVHEFGKRLPYELQAAMLRHMTARKNLNLLGSPVFAEWVAGKELTSLFNAT